MGKKLDIIGQKFYRLTAIKPVEKTKHGAYKWLFLCDCGEHTKAIPKDVASGNTTSCGCVRKEYCRKMSPPKKETRYGNCLLCKELFKINYSGRIYCSASCALKSPERNKKIAESKIGDKNPMWVGDDVQYKPLHNWVLRNKPKSDSCEGCGATDRRLQAANISQEYKRDINDYTWLCSPCHVVQDGRVEKMRSRPRMYPDNFCIDCKKPISRYKSQKRCWQCYNILRKSLREALNASANVVGGNTGSHPA